MRTWLICAWTTRARHSLASLTGMQARKWHHTVPSTW
jgi:hypothetical protein